MQSEQNSPEAKAHGGDPSLLHLFLSLFPFSYFPILLQENRNTIRNVDACLVCLVGNNPNIGKQKSRWLPDPQTWEFPIHCDRRNFKRCGRGAANSHSF